MFEAAIAATRPLRYWLDGVQFRRKADKQHLTELKDSFAGKPMLVIGNGPSLNETPLDDFVDVPSIGMNKIDLLFSRVQWRPSLIVCVNNLVTKQHGESFADSEIPVLVSWKGRKLLSRDLRDRLRYFHSLPTTEFSKDVVQGVGFGGTVTYCALQFAYFMGASTVVLFGVDHSFAAEGKAHQIKKRSGPDVNHFDPNYFAAGSYWGLPDLEASEIAYRTAKHVFENDGRRIYDATINGQLDVFEKISVDRAKELCGID